MGFNDDLGGAVPDDDDGFNVDFNRYETEESLNSEFRDFHAWYEAETGERYEAGYIPAEIFEKFNQFDFETGRHLSLVESVQRVIKEAEDDALMDDDWATTDY